MQYVKSAGGIATGSAYPYTAGSRGTTSSCQTNLMTNKVVTVSNYVTVSGETAMGNYVTATGPLSITVDASTWNSYIGIIGNFEDIIYKKYWIFQLICVFICAFLKVVAL